MESVPLGKERKTPQGITAIMDTHKTDAELSVLSSGDEVCHRLPEKSRLTSVLSEVPSTSIRSARLIANYYPRYAPNREKATAIMVKGTKENQTRIAD
jgi:hypothetical protein